jgi:hypothetical protein
VVRDGRLEIDAKVTAPADLLAQDGASLQAILVNKAAGGITVQDVCVTSHGTKLKEVQEALERINELPARQVDKMIDPRWCVVDIEGGTGTVQITFSRV